MNAANPQDVLASIQRNRTTILGFALASTPMAMGLLMQKGKEQPGPAEVARSIEENRKRLGAFAAEVSLVTGRNPLDRDDSTGGTANPELRDER